MRIVLILLFGILAIPLLHGQELNVQYERLDGTAFHERIVGNTVVGITRQSKSLYMLYFASDGVCELSKGQKVYAGKWWIDKDALGQDVVHAIWPEYQSSKPGSLFHPDNPRYGDATSVWYYGSTSHPNALMLATKSFQVAAMVVPGRQLGGIS